MKVIINILDICTAEIDLNNTNPIRSLQAIYLHETELTLPETEAKGMIEMATRVQNRDNMVKRIRDLVKED